MKILSAFSAVLIATTAQAKLQNGDDLFAHYSEHKREYLNMIENDNNTMTDE